MGVVLKTLHLPSQTEHTAFQVPSAFSSILFKTEKIKIAKTVKLQQERVQIVPGSGFMLFFPLDSKYLNSRM